MSDRIYTAAELISAGRVAVNLASHDTSYLLDDVVADIEYGRMVSVANLDKLAKQRAIQDVATALHNLLSMQRLARCAHMTDEDIVEGVIKHFAGQLDVMVDAPRQNLTGAAATVYNVTREATMNVEMFFAGADQKTLTF